MNFFLMHPSDNALDGFAAGHPAQGGHRVVSHLENCQECRNRIAFRRNVRAAVSSQPAPEPSPDLLDRVLRDRAAGARVILPVAQRRRHAPYRETVRIAAAAVAVLGLGLLGYYARTSSSGGGAESRGTVGTRADQPDTASGLRDLFLSTVFLPGVASADEPPSRGEILQPVGPQIDGTRMREREVRYQRQYIDAKGARTIGGDGVLSLRSTVVGGLPAWRVERKWTEYANRMPGSRTTHETDAIVLGRRDLRPIERHIDVSPYDRYSRITVSQQFNGDSIYGRMVSEGGDSRGVGRKFLQRIPNRSAPYITDAFGPLFFTSIRVRPNWHGRVSMLGWAVRDNDVFYPIELRVVAKERVTVPAGTFDCWHFIITSGARRFDFWSRVSDGLGVLSRNETQRSTVGTSEIVLMRDIHH